MEEVQLMFGVRSLFSEKLRVFWKLERKKMLRVGKALFFVGWGEGGGAVPLDT